MPQKTKPNPAKSAKKQEAPREEEALKVRASNSDQGELSDADLESVTGGKPTASAHFMKSCATGKHIKEGIITV